MYTERDIFFPCPSKDLKIKPNGEWGKYSTDVVSKLNFLGFCGHIGQKY